MKRFRKIYAQNPSFRIPSDPLEKMCEELVFVCDAPMFDEYSSPDFRTRFEHKIESKMSDFDPRQDAIAFYGDSAILAMMVVYVIMRNDTFVLLRYSNKKEEYVDRLISENWFDKEPLDV